MVDHHSFHVHNLTFQVDSNGWHENVSNRSLCCTSICAGSFAAYQYVNTHMPPSKKRSHTEIRTGKATKSILQELPATTTCVCVRGLNSLCAPYRDDIAGLGSLPLHAASWSLQVPILGRTWKGAPSEVKSGPFRASLRRFALSSTTYISLMQPEGLVASCLSLVSSPGNSLHVQSGVMGSHLAHITPQRRMRSACHSPKTLLFNMQTTLART